MLIGNHPAGTVKFVCPAKAEGALELLGGGVKALRTPSTYAPRQFYFKKNLSLLILFQVLVTLGSNGHRSKVPD